MQLTEQDIQWSQQPGHHIIKRDDSDYPVLLKEISSSPAVLYVRGDKTLLHSQQIAMVGARNATPIGLQDAEAFAQHFAQAGFTVTSGLALGIDGAAHRGALKAKGKTVAVMGTGQLHLYPHQHKALAEQIIAEGGAIVSEFPLDTKPVPYNFPRRNRIISGLSMGVLVVEAALKSGSLTTAKHALEQNREVFAMPGSIHNPVSRGCHQLIRQGAKLVESAQDILEELGGFLKMPKQQNQLSLVEITTEQADLLAQIDYAVTSLDVIVLRSRLTVGEVSSILLSLELAGYIGSVTGGYIRI